VKYFDCIENSHAGWLEKIHKEDKQNLRNKADKRFQNE
jgi:hypothetical protein